MAKVEGVEHQRQGSVTAFGTRSWRGRPLMRRLLEPFRRTCGVGLALALCYVGLVGAAGAATITEFPVTTVSSQPLGITAGPDGALWFTEYAGNKIGRITTAGTITEFSIPTGSSQPVGITAGPDGALWFTEFAGNKIGRITTAGTITEFSLSTGGSEPVGITAGPDGALWFTEFTEDKIGRITTVGTITEFSLPKASSGPRDITAGPDGALWFTELTGNKVGRITPAGTITEFPIPTASSGLFGMTAGPDGALWFTELTSNEIGRITTAGTITEFPIPTASSRALGITAGSDGALWFIESNSNQIGWIVPDPVWSAAVFLNSSVFHTGQTITYKATTFPGTTPPKVDIYLGVLLPDGVTFLSFVPGPGGTIAFAFGPVPVPFSANVTLAPTVVPFSYTFTGGESVGTYLTYAGLVMAGSDPLQPANQLSVGVQPFEFTP
ncbi:hypothetical protein [Candidatus Methylomirabilis sp.]|uniref:Vgb family protein n=1 Tax=Candidatus Methylomirabilis sp. TaxID=2032687 RepID=UPI002A633411|nr:hypothetical protein [Candidatus Methylomirabilis sp.]